MVPPLLLFLPLLPCASAAAAPPPLAAAAPLLPGRPFVVVWNMPTSRCQKRFDVHLDLRDFDIVQNRRQSFQGEKVSLFYRGRLGKYPYLSKDGRWVNGGIPQLGDLAAHLSLAETQISNLLLPNFTGSAVVDWEEWRPLWNRNFGRKAEYRRLSEWLVRRERPDLPDEETTAAARREFEESARRFMEETLRLAVRLRPKGLWGFYGFPYCYNWHQIKTDQSYTGRCHSGTRGQNDRLSWLWSQSAALYPSIYLPQRLAGSSDAALMVRHRLLEALRVASVWRRGNNSSQATPVISYTRPAFIHTLNFLNTTDLMHTLGESAALGAAGAVMWGELRFAKSKPQCLLLRDYVHDVLGPFVRSLRTNSRRCSLQRCHGNGRCTRRDPGSGHMISSGVGTTSKLKGVNVLPDPSGDARQYGEHFLCRCSSGWRGETCQEKEKKKEKKKK
ncbi:hyaluronidase-3 isoform X2 [Genypterus blacodes]|uniref:hyaluronidase-3 isoform X2 n=1 Tax=Genypterus blacodes TaxID=154954 RepID=UPI003F761D2F